MHPLDNPIWSSLTTIHAALAITHGRARRYPAEINTLAALEKPDEDALLSLAKLARERETVALFLESKVDSTPGWELVRWVSVDQMIYKGEGASAADNGVAVVRLGAADSPEIVALAKLTNPGPIGPRTYEVGDFIGVRMGDEKRLVAMAGERLRFPGYAEISGVCTHPEMEGRGFAAMLVRRIVDRIRVRGETPCLHVRSDNARAIKLYERLGFERSHRFDLAILRRL